MRLALTFLILTVGVSLGDSTALPDGCRQCLVVTTESWSTPRGQLLAFERSGDANWRRRGIPVPVRVGRAGLAWGRGLLEPPPPITPHKIEGDNKAPAGVFRLGTAFGYACQSPPTRLPYLALTNNIVGVDDPQSRYYNHLIDLSKVRERDWRHAEKMLLGDDRYKWGVVVQHNMPPKRGSGSCIFLHVWKDSETPTTGCTAMPERALLDLMKWLDPERHPLLIQLPVRVYDQMKDRWNLPERKV